jgi:hypothetical protein
MSTTKLGTIVRPSELFQKQETDQALRQPFRFKVDPDLAAVCAFAAIGLLLSACTAIAFPQWAELAFAAS